MYKAHYLNGPLFYLKVRIMPWSVTCVYSCESLAGVNQFRFRDLQAFSQVYIKQVKLQQSIPAWANQILHMILELYG